MRGFFNFDGPLFTFMSKVADLFWLNLLFIVCSLPIVTIGASATAMYYVTLKMVRNEEGYITKDFFKSFKLNFKQATAIWLIALAIIFVLYIDYKIMVATTDAGMMANPTVRTIILVAMLVLAIFFAFTLRYVFPILSRFDNTVKNTIRNSFFISIRHIPYTLLMFVMDILPLVLLYFFPRTLIMILIIFSLVAYGSSFFFVKIFEKYMPKPEEEVAEGALTDDMSEEVSEEGTLTEGLLTEGVSEEVVVEDILTEAVSDENALTDEAANDVTDSENV